jgi:hypothetical protein
MSSEAGHVKVCKLLLECHANVNLEDYKCDARPLHIFFNVKAGSRFCSERCNSLRLFSIQTALHLCSAAGHVEICKLLVEYEADVNWEDEKCDASP